MIARKTSTHAVTGTAGTTRCMTCDTPPYIAPTCSCVPATITAHAQISQLTRSSRGPGSSFSASRPVRPVAIV